MFSKIGGLSGLRASALNVNQQNLKNTQIHADTCRNIQTNNVTKNAQQPKLQSLVGDFEIAISCTDPQSPMTGGGGARDARRIRIRRPRLSGRGRRRVKSHSAIA